jgi:microcystin-dependent protein
MPGKLAAALALAMVAGVSPAFAQANEPFLGEIAVFGFNFCPTGWAALNGQLFNISQNAALFSLLGTTYGGDGKSTFAVPKARPILTATGVALTQCIALEGIFPPRD